MKITLIGLGNMGSAIATRLLQAGFDLTVYNRTTRKTEALVKLGAKTADTVEQAVREADIIMSCLFDDASVIELSETLFSSATQAKTYIATETLLPDTSKTLAKKYSEHGLNYVTACCVGVPPAALRGELGVLFGGPREDYEALRPIFAAYCAMDKKYTHVGATPFLANVLKIATNYMLYSAIEAMGEVHAFTESVGLDKAHLRELFESIYQHKGFLLYADRIINEDFEQVNFSLAGGIKDAKLYQKAFLDQGVSPDILAVTEKHLLSAQASEADKHKDFSVFSQGSKLKKA
ncbi:MAG: oxidoreductase [Gammaproteobacteria bacterium CG11_big_fil_rev_8_21_14_0_20_46_22]|nr:MAG: oxidoreductase [Gammaproteobacteria bacterium CG12_big_fil_rev_8_21_14_0_65_46_12]PIR10886.1 MAG: oxidoreductase [Gammaproteobacteria bacterium CG11_big_fil_rev_8_21_14_0_20_46_22]